MRIKILNRNPDGEIRLETTGSVKEVMVNEDFLHPGDESIAIGFKGNHASGIIELTTNELEELYRKVNRSTHLIKGFKIYRE